MVVFIFFCQLYFRFFYVISLRADYRHNLFNRKKQLIRDENVGKLHLTNNEVLLNEDTVTHTRTKNESYIFRVVAFSRGKKFIKFPDGDNNWFHLERTHAVRVHKNLKILLIFQPKPFNQLDMNAFSLITLHSSYVVMLAVRCSLY